MIRNQSQSRERAFRRSQPPVHGMEVFFAHHLEVHSLSYSSLLTQGLAYVQLNALNHEALNWE